MRKSPLEIRDAKCSIPFQRLTNLRSLQVTDLAVYPYSATTAVAAGAGAEDAAQKDLEKRDAAAVANSIKPQQHLINNLAALQKLTQLELHYASVDLRAIAALTGLQQLKLHYVSDISAASTNAVLQDSLQQLRQLTRLILVVDGLANEDITGISSMTKLQHLELDYTTWFGTGDTRRPTSLT